MSRVAIVGSRAFPHRDFDLIDGAVQDIPLGSVLVSGGADGVDKYAARAARILGLRVAEHLPNYAVHGRGAPLERNTLIVADCDEVIAFWDGKSRGTADTILKAHAAGKRVSVVLPRGGAKRDLEAK